MGLFKSHQGSHLDGAGRSKTQDPQRVGRTLKSPSRLPPSRQPDASVSTYTPPSEPLPQRNIYNPPPEPPPGRSRYAAPPGHPGQHLHNPPSGPPGLNEYASPGHPPRRSQYAPPLAPPGRQNDYMLPIGSRSHERTHFPNYEEQLAQNEYASRPGQPPSLHQSAEEPPSYHDWTVIPDNALLPPPPSLRYVSSPYGNASLMDANRAHDWCRRHPLIIPHQPTPEQYASVNNGDVRLIKPLEYPGDLCMVNVGTWKGSTRVGSNDSCLISSAPLYFAFLDSPIKTRKSKTIYFELKIHSLARGHGTDEPSIALGYCGIPYPTWRLPGWERGSLGVHGDDGRRYVNDTWGGKDFTSAFVVGDTVGLGMSFSLPDSPPDYDAPPNYSGISKVEVFFTKNGKLEGGWNLHEELDQNDQGVDGLEGEHDLCGAIGTHGSVEFDCLFNRHDWLWLPR